MTQDAGQDGTSRSARWGLTVPLDGRPLAEQRDLLRAAVAAGWTDAWSAEADGTDAFTPLALAAAWEPSLRLGTAVVPVFTRGPALLAQSAAAMAEAAPGRFVLGVGASSPAIVERWNGLAYDRPYARVRDTVRFLRAALAGQKVDEEYETFRVRGFRLGRVPAVPPPIVVAALRPQMLRLAGREADGAVLNWLSAADVRAVVPEVGAGKEIVARVFACPSPDADLVRAQLKPLLAAYLTVPGYAAFHRWLGRDEVLAPVWQAWAAGDRRGAVAAIPDHVVDELIVHGDADACREHIARYLANGVTTVTVAVVPAAGVDVAEAVTALAPPR